MVYKKIKKLRYSSEMTQLSFELIVTPAKQRQIRGHSLYVLRSTWLLNPGGEHNFIHFNFFKFKMTEISDHKESNFKWLNLKCTVFSIYVILYYVEGISASWIVARHVCTQSAWLMTDRQSCIISGYGKTSLGCGCTWDL